MNPGIGYQCNVMLPSALISSRTVSTWCFQAGISASAVARSQSVKEAQLRTGTSACDTGNRPGHPTPPRERPGRTPRVERGTQCLPPQGPRPCRARLRSDEDLEDPARLPPQGRRRTPRHARHRPPAQPHPRRVTKNQAGQRTRCRRTGKRAQSGTPERTQGSRCEMSWSQDHRALPRAVGQPGKTTPSGSRTLAVAVQMAFSGRWLLGEQLDRDVAARGVGVRANLVGGLDELATDFPGQAVR